MSGNNLPKYNEFYKDVLKLLSDGSVKSAKQIRKEVADRRMFSEEERALKYESGNARILPDRINWACVYLNGAQYLERPKRAHYRITQEGLEAIEKYGYDIPQKVVRKRYNYFKDLENSNTEKESIDKTEEINDISPTTPEDTISQAFKELNTQLASELLEEVQSMNPYKFETLVLDLLHTMGYGGKIKDSIIETQKSNDGGFDGMIKEDALGLDHVYIQAKRWKTGNNVGRRNIQQFAGALSGVDARKGVFITTSDFTNGAVEYAEKLKNMKIILIKGSELTKLMIDYDIGVNTERVYKKKTLDLDYFVDED